VASRPLTKDEVEPCLRAHKCMTLPEPSKEMRARYGAATVKRKYLRVVEIK